MKLKEILKRIKNNECLKNVCCSWKAHDKLEEDIKLLEKEIENNKR